MLNAKSVRLAVLIIAPLLPWALRRLLYQSLFKWDLAKDARIGFSYVDATHVRLGPGARIGHGNVVRGLGSLELRRGAVLKNFNSVFGTDNVATFPTRTLTIGEGSLVMSWHFIDTCGEVEIGRRTTIGGRSTQIWSHARFFREGAPNLGPARVKIGDDVYVGARATIAHCEIPDGATVATGAVVTNAAAAGDLSGPLLLIGNPAEARERSGGNRQST
jgi:acetyltransferase-like isoleucine patch superfamily enzyme